MLRDAKRLRSIVARVQETRAVDLRVTRHVNLPEAEALPAIADGRGVASGLGHRDRSRRVDVGEACFPCEHAKTVERQKTRMRSARPATRGRKKQRSRR